MPFDLLLPPLLGGFLFLINFNGTSYRSASFGGYRLIFFTAIVGFFSLIIAALLLDAIDFAQQNGNFHKIAMPITLGALALTAFGSYEGAKRHFKELASRDREIDSDDNFEADVKERRFYVATLICALAILLSVIILLHGWKSAGLDFTSTDFAAILAEIGALAFLVHKVKNLSYLRGYQVAFRLGLTMLVGGVSFIVCSIFAENIEEYWIGLVPFEYAGHSVLAFLVPASLWFPLNYLYPYEAAIDRLIDSGNVDGLEVLVHHASTTLKQIMITLDDNKVYIGFVSDEIPIAGRTDNYLSIMPTVSGYRQSHDKKLVLTTSYLELFVHSIDQEIELDDMDLIKTVRITDIRTVSVFDPDLYERPETFSGFA